MFSKLFAFRVLSITRRLTTGFLIIRERDSLLVSVFKARGFCNRLVVDFSARALDLLLVSALTEDLDICRLVSARVAFFKPVWAITFKPRKQRRNMNSRFFKKKELTRQKYLSEMTGRKLLKGAPLTKKCLRTQNVSWIV